MKTEAEKVAGGSDRSKVVAILGDGQVAAECVRIAAQQSRIKLVLVIHHEDEQQFSQQVRKACANLGISEISVTSVNEQRSLRALETCRPDVIFNINSWDIIRRGLLDVPRDFIVNFHNGPLPQYRGVNCPSWGIFNQEKKYGVTWHLVSRGIDSGDVVAAQEVFIGDDDTAIRLIFKCIDAGVKLFSQLLDDYISGSLKPRPQRGEARYYSAGDVPNDGLLDFTWSYERLSALVRSLNFRPFENPMMYPGIRIGEHSLFVTEIVRVSHRGDETSWTCGEIRKIDENGAVVCADDGCVRLSGLMDEDLEFLPAAEIADAYGLTVGDVLSGA